jgi:hypothetical protein
MRLDPYMDQFLVFMALIWLQENILSCLGDLIDGPSSNVTRASAQGSIYIINFDNS